MASKYPYLGFKHEFLKVAQIKHISRNQLHCPANLNFGLMCKKAKHCWALLTTNFSVQLIVFLDHVLLLAELAKKIQIASKKLYGKVIP